MRTSQRKSHSTGRIHEQSGGKFTLDAYRNFTTLVMDTARRTSSCIKELLSIHRGLTTGLEAFLSYDAALIDESAMNIVTELFGAFASIEKAFNVTVLRQVEEAGQEIVNEIDRITDVLRVWGEAAEEQEHYENKVASLQKQSAGGEKLARNRDKLVLAKNNVSVKKAEGEAELSLFGETRVVMLRATLICFLRLYMPMLAQAGTEASVIAKKCAAELEQGSRIEIQGLKKAKALNGQYGIIESAESDGKRLRVLLQSGEQKSVRMENLIPVLSHTPGLEDRGGVVERPVEKPPKTEEEPEEALVDEPVRERSRWNSFSEETLSEAPRIGFGSAGRNIELLRVRGGGDAAFSWLPVIAARPDGILHGLSFTAAPLVSLPGSVHASRGAQRFYFEVLVLESTSTGAVRTISVGFAWPPASASKEEAPTDSWVGPHASFDASAVTPNSEANVEQARRAFSLGADVLTGRSLPESSQELPYGFSVGGEPCKAFLGGLDKCKVSGWRPVKDVESGTRIGCLLEQDSSILRISVFQDGEQRCLAEVDPQDYPTWAKGPPHGLVDVCGSVRRVQLLQTLNPPEASMEC